MVENLENEIWKPVVGFEDKYEVSNMGRVKSVNYRGHGNVNILKPSVNHAGYLTVILTVNWKKHKKRIHRLVYEAFIAPLPSYNPQKSGNTYFEVNHIDEDKTNNKPYNLELVTHTENVRYGSAIKRKSAKQINGKKSKKSLSVYTGWCFGKSMAKSFRSGEKRYKQAGCLEQMQPV